MRVLLVEDDTLLGSAVRDQIAADGHGVDWAKRLGEAADSLQVAAYDLILLDLMLPDGRGLDFLRARRLSNTRSRRRGRRHRIRNRLVDRLNKLSLVEGLQKMDGPGIGYTFPEGLPADEDMRDETDSENAADSLDSGALVEMPVDDHEVGPVEGGGCDGLVLCSGDRRGFMAQTGQNLGIELGNHGLILNDQHPQRFHGSISLPAPPSLSHALICPQLACHRAGDAGRQANRRGNRGARKAQSRSRRAMPTLPSR